MRKRYNSRSDPCVECGLGVSWPRRSSVHPGTTLRCTPTARGLRSVAKWGWGYELQSKSHAAQIGRSRLCCWSKMSVALASPSPTTCQMSAPACFAEGHIHVHPPLPPYLPPSTAPQDHRQPPPVLPQHRTSDGSGSKSSPTKQNAAKQQKHRKAGHLPSPPPAQNK